MKTNTLLTLTASVLLTVAGCAVEPRTTTSFHNQPRVVLTAAQRNDSNNYPDPAKPDDVMKLYLSYSPDVTRNSLLSGSPHDTTVQYIAPPLAQPTYGGYGRYGGYAAYGSYIGYGGMGRYEGSGGYGGYGGYGYGGGYRSRW